MLHPQEHCEMPLFAVCSCEVAAEPSEGVSFEWRVNSTTTTSNSNRRSTALTGRVMRRKGNIAVSVAEFSPKVSCNHRDEALARQSDFGDIY